MKLFLRWFVILLTILVVACTKVTQANFDQIRPGMTKDEVITILGQPSSMSSANFGGISGTSATWQHGNDVITIVFLNDKVQIKTFGNAGKTNINTDTQKN